MSSSILHLRSAVATRRDRQNMCVDVTAEEEVISASMAAAVKENNVPGLNLHC